MIVQTLGPVSIELQDVPRLRRVVRKARSIAEAASDGSAVGVDASGLVTTAFAVLSLFARPGGRRAGWDDVAPGIRRALSRIAGTDLSRLGGLLNRILAFIEPSVPVRILRSDDLVGWVYQLCNEGTAVRRKQGQYYTPGWLAGMILGLCAKALADGVNEGKRLDWTRVRLLDPACGCGAFLLPAAHIIAEKSQGAYGRGSKEVWQRILSSQLFGMDVDERAVEVSGLSLALLATAHGAALDGAIGNLLARDFLGEALAPAGALARLGTDAGGGLEGLQQPAQDRLFDIVVGNPPYLGFHQHSSSYRRQVLSSYRVFDGKADVFYYFIERGLEVLRDGGVLGYVIPRYWLAADKARRLREFVASRSEIVHLVDMGQMQVFPKAGVQVCAVVLRKRRPSPSHRIRVSNLSDSRDAAKLVERLRRSDHRAARIPGSFELGQRRLGRLWVFVPKSEYLAMQAIERSADKSLGEVSHISPGLITGADRDPRTGDGIFVISAKELAAMHLLPAERAVVKPWIKNSHVRRWMIRPSDYYLLYVTKAPCPRTMPNILHHLEAFRGRLEARYEVARAARPWWRLVRPRNPRQFESERPKIVVPFKAARNRFALDDGGRFCSADVYCINPKPSVLAEYLCCLLNSSLLEFYVRRIAKRMGSICEYYAHTLVMLPIKLADTGGQQRFAALHGEIAAEASALSVRERPRTDRLCRLERKLDEMVFELYGIERRHRRLILSSARS